MSVSTYMSRRQVLIGASATALAATLAACGSSDKKEGKSGEAVGEGDASQVDVVTWWQAGSERTA